MNRVQHHMKPQPDPQSWASGPPNTPSEGWQWERRKELAGLANTILLGMVRGSDVADPFLAGTPSQAMQGWISQSVQAAVAFQDALDAARPRA